MAWSATAYNVPVTGSMTGVLVMPRVGEMSPQGSSEEGTGAPRLTCQACAPVVSLKAYRSLFSVAAMTRPAKTSGSAQTLPPSLGTLQAGVKGSAEPLLWSTPVSAPSAWSVVQSGPAAGTVTGGRQPTAPTQAVATRLRS